MAQFGKQHAGANYGLVFTSVGIAGLIGALGKGELESLVGGFSGLTYLMGGLCAAGAVLTLAIKLPKAMETGVPE